MAQAVKAKAPSAVEG